MRELLSPATVIRRYSFAFALVLAIVLLAVDVLTQTSFGFTAQLAAVAPLALLALASTPSIVSGGLDISLGPIAALLTAIYVITLDPNGLGGAIAVPILLAIGAALGAFNGVMVAVFRVNPVVATLSGYFIVYGVVLSMLAQPTSLRDNWVAHLGGSVGPVPGAVFTLGAPIVIWVLLKRTAYMRNLFAVGASDAAAYSSGVNVTAVRVMAYSLGGLFAGFVAFALLALIHSADPSAATAYSLLAFAAVALGGTPLAGGRGGFLGPMIGAASLYLIQDILISHSVSQTWLQVVYGCLLVFAVLLSARIVQVQKGIA